MKNQTEPQWVLSISDSAKGSGLFIFPDSNSGEFSNQTWSCTIQSQPFGRLRKAIVGEIGYLDCVHRGARDWIIAFKWIPATVATLDDTITAATSCGEGFCVHRCEGYGCLCVSGECK